MNNYQYIAKDKNGHAISGIIEGNSEVEVAEILHKRELIVISVSPTKKKKIGKLSTAGKVTADDLAIFSRQLATMIDAGIPLVQSLGILAEQLENKALKNIVMISRQDIEGGMSFCDALAKHHHVFSELFINMAKAGEASGMLDDVLERLATYLEKNAALTRKVKSSLVYPAVVITMAVVITAFLLVKVVPTFKGIFDTLGGKLPLPTLVLIGISDVFRKYLLFVVIGMAISSVAFKKFITTPKGRRLFDAFKLRAPILGQLFRKVAVAKFARTFSTLVKSGVSVLNALDIVGKTSGNKVVEEAIIKSRIAVREGEPIASPLQKSGVFPPMVCRMVGVGEQTGQLEKMLSKIADFYDEQVDAQVSALTSLIEPLVIAFLGIIVGGIVVALFLPIFKITELIGR